VKRGEGVREDGRKWKRRGEGTTDETSNDCSCLSTFPFFRSDCNLRGRCPFWDKYSMERNTKDQTMSRDVRYPHFPIKITVSFYGQSLLLCEEPSVRRKGACRHNLSCCRVRHRRRSRQLGKHDSCNLLQNRGSASRPRSRNRLEYVRIVSGPQLDP